MNIQMAHSLGCSIFRLAGFGEQNARGYSDEYDEFPPAAKTITEFKKLCREAVGFNDRHSDGHNKVEDQAIMCAYTISKQPLAEQFLKELGFQSFNSGKYEKYKGHTATLWFMTTKDFLEAIKE